MHSSRRPTLLSQRLIDPTSFRNKRSWQAISFLRRSYVFYVPAFGLSCAEKDKSLLTDVLSDANLQRLASFRYAHISVRRTQKPAEISDSNPILNLSQPANGENNLTPAPQASWACTLQPRWAPKLSSQWDVLKDQVIRSHPPGICTLFYAFPYMSPGFMAINYLVCGPRTDYTTLRICLEIATEIARARGCQAIVCQAFSELLNERLMKRCDFVPHAKNLGPNHYIRRLAPRLSC